MALAEVAATACRQGRFKVAAMVAGGAGGGGRLGDDRWGCHRGVAFFDA